MRLNFGLISLSLSRILFNLLQGYTLLWKCCLRAHNYDDAIAAFRKVQEMLKDKENDKYKEFVKFFQTSLSHTGKLIFLCVFTFERRSKAYKLSLLRSKFQIYTILNFTDIEK